MQHFETTIREKGRLVLENLPFEPGQDVEVFVMPKSSPGTPSAHLLGSVLEYRDPLDPVAVDDWESAE